MEKVSEEIIAYAILPRLPAKALIRFQCVSKSWRALISADARFQRLQSNYARSSPALLLFGETPKPVFLSHSEGERNPPRSIGFPDICGQLREKSGGPRPEWLPVAACGGYLCAAITSPRDGDAITQLYLGNPVLGNWRPLPPPPRRAPRNAARTMGLAVYETTESRHAYRLFIPFCTNVGEGRTEAAFWALSSAGLFWQTFGPRVLLNSRAEWFHFQCNVCVEGIYFWRAAGEVLWLDPKEERGGTIPLPYADAADEYWIIGEWDGKLSFMSLIDWRIHMWLWNQSQSQSQSSWSFRVLLTIEDIARGNPDFFASMGLRMNLRNRNAESLDVILGRTRASIFAFGVGFILLQVDSDVLCYDATTGKAWKLKRRVWGYEDKTRPFAYVNSLLRLIVPLFFMNERYFLDR